MPLFRALRVRSFALLWAGQTVSRAGDAIHIIAIAWIVLQLTGSAGAMGVVLTANLVPYLVFALIGGVAVDRLPRLLVMLVSDLSRMAVVALIAVLVATHTLAFWHLPFLAGFFGAVSAFFEPAYAAVVPDLVGPDLRSSANALQQVGRRAARTIGPAVGATIIATWSSAGAFVVDALTFALSAALVILAARAERRAGRSALLGRATEADAPEGDERTRETGPAPSALSQLREGFATVAASPWILISILTATFSSLTLVAPLEAVMPLLVTRGFGGGVAALGIIETCLAGGSVLGAVVLGSRGRIRRRGYMTYVPWIVSALGVAVAGLPIGIVGLGVDMVVTGIALAVLNLAWTSSLQDLVPPDRLGRVFSIDALGSAGLVPLGFLLAGQAADVVGPSLVVLVGGLVSAAVISLGLLHPSVRALD